MQCPCRNSSPLRSVLKLPNTAATSVAMREPSSSTKKRLCTVKVTARSAQLSQCVQCAPLSAAVSQEPFSSHCGCDGAYCGILQEGCIKYFKLSGD